SRGVLVRRPRRPARPRRQTARANASADLTQEDGPDGDEDGELAPAGVVPHWGSPAAGAPPRGAPAGRPPRPESGRGSAPADRGARLRRTVAWRACRRART